MSGRPLSVNAALGASPATAAGAQAPPRVRMFCFPYAGGSARIFNGWGRHLPAGVEVCPVEFPGHGMRFSDPLYDRLDPLVEDLLPGVVARADAPVVLFGHSLGALVAFELGRRLAGRHRIIPRHLIVSALRAPHLPRTGVPEHTLPEPEFRARLREFDGTPEEVLADETLMEVIGPILRADLAVPATYRHPPGARVSWPITAFAGLEDTEAPPDDVGAWQEETTAEFSLRVLPDGHFFLHSQEGPLLRAVAGLLRTVRGAR
jgi:medium-chain acyl-[acyl-carrier-protein] hydrolase